MARKSQAVDGPATRKPAQRKKAVNRSAADAKAAAGSAAPSAPAPVVCETRHDCSVLRFGAACTIDEAAQMRVALLEQLAVGKPLVLDASRIEDIDTAGLQLLVGLSIDCMERGIPYAWKAQSAPLKHAMGVLGVGALMESPGAVAQYSGLLD